MLNSLLMLGSSYNKDKKISILFMVSWIIFMISKSYDASNYTMAIINLIAFALVAGSIKLIKNRKANTILSISSILLWSIIVDTICYFAYPVFTSGQSLIGYISNGLLFNYKYLLVNVFGLIAINGIIFAKSKLVNLVAEKKATSN